MNWETVRSEEDVERLMARFGGFHDACLREVHIWSDWRVQADLCATRAQTRGTTLRMLVQRQWPGPSAIELLFEQVVGFHMLPAPQNYDPMISEAVLELRADGTLYWSDAKHYSGASPEPGGVDNTTWVTAMALSWREASEWMGEQLRYGGGGPASQPGEVAA